MYYVYILFSTKKLKFYKGLTDNLERRLLEHFSGNEISTRHMLPLELVHVEICSTRIGARRLEEFFKSGYGREIIKELAEII